MRLHGEDGSEVTLQPTGYQFPGRTAEDDRDWDANWLNIHGQVRVKGRSWTFTDACLTTWEASQLGNWLRGVATGATKPDPIDGDDEGGTLLVFTEPNIAMSLQASDGERATVRFYFSLESAPPWVEDRGDAVFEYHVELTTPLEMVAAAADEWEQELRRFPKR
jgi:hypothetical protein